MEVDLLDLVHQLQQPSRRAFDQVVDAVAEERLGQLDHRHLRVVLEDVADAVLVQERTKIVCTHGDGVARNLACGAHRHLVRAEEDRQPHESIVADDARVHAVALGRLGDERHGAGEREHHHLDDLVCAVDLPATVQLEPFQPLAEQLENRPWQRRKEAVAPRLVDADPRPVGAHAGKCTRAPRASRVCWQMGEHGNSHGFGSQQ